MIKQLSIKDFAIIPELEVDLHPGLTIITGETGAGKSILVRALNIALGARAARTDVRTGQQRSVVEVETWQDGQGLTCRRLVRPSGRTRSFLNDAPVPEGEFRQAVRGRADFHGQHEQQYIMDPGTHIEFLDRFCQLDEQVEEIQSVFQSRHDTLRRLEEGRVRRQASRERRELLSFQSREIELVNPRENEDSKLEQEFVTLNHVEELVEKVERFNRRFLEEDDSIYQQLVLAKRDLEQLLVVDPSIAPFLESLDQAAINLQDTAAGLRGHVSRMERDQQRLETIEERIQVLETLKRKYGGILAAVLDYHQEIKSELAELKGLGDSIGVLEQELEDLNRRYQSLADELHQGRATRAVELSRAVEATLEELHMPEARFIVVFSQEEDPTSGVHYGGAPVKLFPRGYDRVEFHLSANPGEDPKPLAKVASGGEVSRIMLGIKTVLRAIDPVDTLIFDEIDAGISGVAAERVAANLLKLSTTKQVICVTHLPQIAAKAQHHLEVTKTMQRNRTRVAVRYLDREERVRAIAELFSGEEVSAPGLDSVRQSLDEGHG